MMVKHILADKGTNVFTLPVDASGMDALNALAEHNIGALVIASPEKKIKGILSERDIVRAIARTGTEALQRPVADLMTTKVRTCSEESTVHEVMELMTEGRFRHLPVERDGRLIGVISIGDVVKRRIMEVEREAEEIRSYIASA
ncbi:CBS domain-containing protein [Oricola thermophila]|uniref:CBS domain-containing protein n=1 Tax=Oricola thermophila TaxID=2742145 RepID=A0A6N1VM91_9HYPH|nr:CBS domain-containing protein [Oricola thermophila]QKV20552.1 CBS domain-containing protein [Oricola thermophila]